MDNLQEEMNEESENTSRDFYNSRKKLVWLLIIIVLFVIIGLAVTKKDNRTNTNSDNIVFDNNVESIMIGSAKKISASIIDNPIYEVRYQSGNENIINVDKYGLVEGVGLGSTNLKAFYFDANGKEHSIERKITVFEGNTKINITNASFPEGDVVIKLYGEYDLGNKLIVTPSSGYISSKVFRSSNEEVVGVSPSGRITAISEGEAIINVRVNNQFDSNIKVYVTNEQNGAEIIKLPETVNFDTNVLKLNIGETKNVGYTLKPDNAIDKFLTWVSSDQTVATVTNGIIYAVGKGNCDITLRSINGKSAKLFVEVTEQINVEKIKFNESSIIIKNNGITASIRVNVTGKDVNGVSNNDGAITVRINSNITPAKEYSNNIKYTNPASITITKNGSVETVKYCYAPYNNATCTPNLIYYSAFNIPSGDLYLLRVQKFDGYGKEIVGSNNDNYRNGALEYYINTQSDDYYKDIGYKMDGTYYSTVTEANNNFVTDNVKLTFKFINTVTDKLKICYTTGISCDPDKKYDKVLNKNGLKSFELTEDGLWKIFISEYSNDNKVGTTKKYYVKIVKNDTGYVIDGNYYATELEANNNLVNATERLTFNIVGKKTSKLRICFNQDSICNPDSLPDKVISTSTISNYIDLPRSGLWYICVTEYNGDNKLSEKVYYVTIK